MPTVAVLCMRLGVEKTIDFHQYPPVIQRTDIYNNHRTRHTLVLGQSGTGKSTTMERWAIDDILDNEGVIFIDPHGSSVNQILHHIPRHRRNDTILFDASDTQYPIGFNPLQFSNDHAKTASTIVDIFKSEWKDNWGPYPDQFVLAGVMALLDYPRATLLDLRKLLKNKDFRHKVLNHVTRDEVKDYWLDEFEQMSKRDQQERPMSTTNKLWPLILDTRIANILGQPYSSFDLRDVIENRKILLLSFPHGELGLSRSRLLMNFFIAQLYATVMDMKNQTPCYVYLDEFHHIGPFFAELLSGARKFNLGLTFATQFMGQIEDPRLRDALLGTVGTVMAFRTGPEDAETLAAQFHDDSSSLMPFEALARTPEGFHRLTVLPTAAKRYAGGPRRLRNLARDVYSCQRRFM